MDKENIESHEKEGVEKQEEKISKKETPVEQRYR
jgi:hypothetical protein